MVDHFIPGTMDPMVAEAVNAANPVMYAFMFDPDRVEACRATVVGDDGVYMYARAAGLTSLSSSGISGSAAAAMSSASRVT